MLSIDFGNTYTKVALRPTVDSPGVLLTDPSLKWDDQLNACVPTLAACHEHGGKAEWHYGTDVMRFRENTPGLTVYRNWKPRFFTATPIGSTVSTRPAPVLARGTLDVPPGLTAEAWATIQADLPPDRVDSLWVKLHGQDGAAVTAQTESVEETDLDHKNIGLGFFRWLREFFDPVCRKHMNVPASEIPVRVSLPSFGCVARAEELLKEILSEAGWTLDDRVPTLPEPLSNAIGTFTEGINAVHRSPPAPHYGQMFQHTGLLSRMREAILADGPKTAWVLIVDVGGYTADFAMVGLDLEDIDARIDGRIDGKPRLAHHSEAIGVTDLDRRVRDLLSATKQKAMDEIITDPDQQRLESFHKNCFGHLGRHALRRVVIGESAKEKRVIREALAQFAEDIADDAEGFLNTHQYDRIDDLILTGGGTMIPVVREVLCKRLNHYGVRKAHFHLLDGEKLPTSISSHPLNSTFVRGATAIGGSSVYFDFAGV